MTNFTRQKLYYIKLGIRRKLSSACREVTRREPRAAAARRAAAAASAAAAPLPMPRAARETGGGIGLVGCGGLLGGDLGDGDGPGPRG